MNSEKKEKLPVFEMVDDGVHETQINVMIESLCLYNDTPKHKIQRAVKFIIEKLKTESNKNKPHVDKNFILKLHEIISEKPSFCKESTESRWWTCQDFELLQVFPIEVYNPSSDEIPDLVLMLTNSYSKDFSSNSVEKFLLWFLYIYPFTYETLTVWKLLMIYLLNSILVFDKDFEIEIVEYHHWVHVASPKKDLSDVKELSFFSETLSYLKIDQFLVS